MTTLTLPRRPFVEFSGVRFRLWPVLLAAVLMQAVLWPARELARWIFAHDGGVFHHQSWAFVGLAMVLQTLAGLACIAVMRRVLPQAPTYLRWPSRGQGLIGLGFAIGAGMALTMLVADYWPQLIGHRAPDGGYDTSTVGVAGWLTVMASTGLCEETIFRGLLVGMLTVLVPGRVRIGRFDIPFSGLVVAVLFGLAHYGSFLADPFWMAIAQQAYAFVFGLVYVWLMERSRSLVAPMIAHGVGDALEVAAVMYLQVAWAVH